MTTISTDPQGRPTVVAGYVHPQYVIGRFHDSLLSLVLNRGGIGGHISVASGPRIATSRNQVCKAFLTKTDSSYLWMLDSDMSFAPDTLDRLLEVAKEHDLPILGALCFGLNDDGDEFPVLFRLQDGKPRRVDNYPDNTLIEVSATGAACLLIRRDVLEKMEIHYPAPYHWFEEASDGEAEVGEDVKFCLKARELGYPIFVDSSISIGHVKQQVVDETSFKRQRRQKKYERRKGK